MQRPIRRKKVVPDVDEGFEDEGCRHDRRRIGADIAYRNVDVLTFDGGEHL